MDFTQLAQDAGCRPEANEDVTRRLEAKFQGEDPSPQAVRRWLQETLKAAAPHLFPQTPDTPWDKLGIARVEWDSLSPSTKLGLARQLEPLPRVTTPHPNRPVAREAPPEKQAEWQDLPLHERVAAYRAWRDSA
jgi:hypothetical protein